MDFFLLVDLRRVVFLAAGLRAAVRFFAVRFFAVDFFAVDLRRVVLRRVALRAVDFFFAADLRRVVFLFAVFRFLVAAPFFAAVFLFAVFRFLVAAPFLAAVERLALFRFVDFLAVDFFLAGDMVTPFPLSRRHALQASPFPFAHPSPHPISLVTTERVVEALDANGTVSADPLGLPG